MKTYNFPYIALGLGLFFTIVVMKGSEAGNDGATLLPLLTLLVISEFSFFVTAAGAFIGIKHIRAVGFKFVYTATTILCLLLAVRFMLLGAELWPL